MTTITTRISTFYDRDGDTYEATTAHAAADHAYGPGNHDGQEMYSTDGQTWTRHVLGSGGADLEMGPDEVLWWMVLDTGAGDFGRLCEYSTGTDLRAATREERDASRAQAKRDGGAGVILDGELRCYVQE